MENFREFQKSLLTDAAVERSRPPFDAQNHASDFPQGRQLTFPTTPTDADSSNGCTANHHVVVASPDLQLTLASPFEKLANLQLIEKTRSSKDGEASTPPSSAETAATGHISDTTVCDACQRPESDYVVLRRCRHTLCYVCLAASVLPHTRKIAFLWRKNARFIGRPAQELFFSTPLPAHHIQPPERLKDASLDPAFPLLLHSKTEHLSKSRRLSVVDNDPFLLKTLTLPRMGECNLLPRHRRLQQRHQWDLRTSETPWSNSRRLKDEYWVNQNTELQTPNARMATWSSADGLLPDDFFDENYNPNTEWGTSVCPICKIESLIPPFVLHDVISQWPSNYKALTQQNFVALLPVDVNDIYGSWAKRFALRLEPLPIRVQDCQALHYRSSSVHSDNLEETDDAASVSEAFYKTTRPRVRFPTKFRPPRYHKNATRNEASPHQRQTNAAVVSRYPMSRCVPFCSNCLNHMKTDSPRPWDKTFEPQGVTNAQKTDPYFSATVRSLLDTSSPLLYCSSCVAYQCPECAYRLHQDPTTKSHRLMVLDLPLDTVPIAPQHMLLRGPPGTAASLLHTECAFSDRTSLATASSEPHNAVLSSLYPMFKSVFW